jgi:hypothetical protein
VLTAYLSRIFKQETLEISVVPKRSIKNMLSFKKMTTSGTFAKDQKAAKALYNNCRAENPRDVVKNIGGVRKFAYFLQDN